MKKNLFVFLVLFMVILPFRVEAATGSLTISCAPTTAKAGEVSTCTITGNSTVDIIDISAVIKLSDNLTMESFELNEIWEGSDFDTKKIDVYTKSGDAIKGNFTLGVMKVKVKSAVVNKDESVTLSSIEFTKDTSEYSVNNATAKIRVPNNVNTLSDLKVSGATFTFKSDTINYDLTVGADVTSVDITATVKDSKSQLSGDTGKKSLKYGVNTFKITVTAEDKSSKIYTLNITRPDNRSRENDVLKFELGNYNLNFDKSKTTYDINVENNISKLVYSDNCSTNYLCLKSDSISVSNKSTYEVLFNDKVYKPTDSAYDLNVGKSVLKVVVTAENETKKTYTFNINRKDKSGNISSGGSSGGSAGGSGQITNPSTGDPLIVGVVVLGVLSLLATVYFFKKNEKKVK